jgi:ectoine hydroxylase-related dioxygenase (phytanoyl-CoA dioxygenase family)
MNSLHTVRRGEKLETINAILEEQGCIVIENMLDEARHEALEARIRPLLDATAPCQGNFYGFATKRLSGLIAKSKACRQMSVEPHILAVMDEFLLRSCRAYQLSLTQAIQIGPGEPQQLIHADDLMFSFEHPGREAMINCMWAVDDFTKENGATLLVPGSHRWPRDRAPEPHEITQGEMSKGSVLIYFGSLLHAGGANRTDTSRTGIVISYCLGWLR